MNRQSKKNIFVAGASGAIGRRLCRLLIDDGWSVIGTTRTPEKAAMLRGLGIEPVIVDVFDESLLLEMVRKAEPEIVVHQLTDLPPALDPTKMAEALVRNARLREIGTRNLVAAAAAAGAKRVVAQSLAFVYAPGAKPGILHFPVYTFGEEGPVRPELVEGREPAPFSLQQVALRQAQGER
ncbi:MAG: NAD-dependent epimerase/dehydratase family protein [Pseudomonadota bacterium]